MDISLFVGLGMLWLIWKAAGLLEQGRTGDDGNLDPHEATGQSGWGE